MAHDIDDRPARPPELYWDMKKVLAATCVFAILGLFGGLVVFYLMTLGFRVSRNKAEIWLYATPAALTAFAFFSTVFFAHRERRRLLDFYRKEDD